MIRHEYNIRDIKSNGMFERAISLLTFSTRVIDTKGGLSLILNI